MMCIDDYTYAMVVGRWLRIVGAAVRMLPRFNDSNMHQTHIGAFNIASLQHKTSAALSHILLGVGCKDSQRMLRLEAWT